MLYIIVSYHCMQFERKLMNQTWENGKKNLVSGPILTQIWASEIFIIYFISTTC